MDSQDQNPAGARYDAQTGQPLQDAGMAAAPAEEAQGFRTEYTESASTTYSPPPASYAPVAQQVPVQVNVTARKRSNMPLIAGLVVLVLLAAAGSGAFYLYNKVVNKPAIAVERLLPANTLGYLTVSPQRTGSQKAALDKMRDAFQSQPGFQEAWTNIMKQASDAGQAAGLSAGGTATPDLSSVDALSSYLGNNVTIAVLPPSTDDLTKIKNAGDNSSSVVADVLGKNVVGLIDLDFNPLNKKGPISDLKQKVDNLASTEVAEKYRDTDIHKYVTATTTIFFSLLDGTSTAVAGAKIEPVRAVIDQFKDNKGLKDDSNFKTLSGQVPAERLATLYLNLTEIYKQVNTASPEAAQSAGISNVQGATLITVSAQNDGMQVDIASQTDLSGTGIEVNPNAKPDASTLADVPNGVLGFLAGTDIKDTATTTLDALAKRPADNGDNMAQSIEKGVHDQSGLDLRKDILSWMGGDFSFSGSASGKASTDTMAAGATFQLKLAPTDHDKAQQTVETLAQKMFSDSSGSASSFDAAGGKFYDIGGSGVIFGTTKDHFYVVIDKDINASKARLNDTVGAQGKGLGSTDTWRTVSPHLPRDSNIVAYLDLNASRTLAEGTISDSDTRANYDKTAAPFVRPFKYVLFGSATQPTKEGNLSRNHVQIFFGIGK